MKTVTSLSRQALAPELYDLHCWPTVDPAALPEPRRALFLRREKAIRQYMEGQRFALIESTTGIRRAQLYQLLARCATPHVDGVNLGRNFPRSVEVKFPTLFGR